MHMSRRRSEIEHIRQKEDESKNFSSKNRLTVKRQGLLTSQIIVVILKIFLEEKEEDKEIDKEKDYVTCKQVIALYHSVCTSYPSVKTLSEARRKAIKARLKIYSLDDFRTLFEKAEASAFLKGGNDRNWTANFDWLIQDANMAKVIDGNYDKQQRPKGSKPSSTNKFNNFPQRDYDFDTLEQQLLNSQQEPQGDK